MRTEIPRSPRTLRRQEAERPQTPAKPSRWDKVLKTGPFIVSLSGLCISLTAMLLTLAINGPALINNAKDLRRWYLTDQDTSGKWNNSSEYDMSPPSWATSENDAIFLDIKAYGGEISGMAVSQHMCKYSPRTDVFVQGRISGDNGYVVFWDYVFGMKRAFLRAKFTVNRVNGQLDFEVTEQAPELFPQTFRLQRSQDIALDEDDGDELVDARTKQALKETHALDHARYRGVICQKIFDAAGDAKQAVKKRSAK